jgi:hypothetical protein
MILPRLGNTVRGMQCTLSGKFIAEYCCQQHDFLLVILSRTFNKNNSSYQKSFWSESDDAVACDSDTELDEDSRSG